MSKEIVVIKDNIGVVKGNYISGITGCYTKTVTPKINLKSGDVFEEYLMAMEICGNINFINNKINWIKLSGINKLIKKFKIKGIQFLIKKLGLKKTINLILKNINYKKNKWAKFYKLESGRVDTLDKAFVRALIGWKQ